MNTTGDGSAAAFVMFGGTGDLASRKLLPALFHNWKQGFLDKTVVIGVGRRCKNRDEYINFLAERVDLAQSAPTEWAEFLKQVDYHHGNISTAEDFQSLNAKVEAVEADRSLSGNRLFYYAVGPNFFLPITQQLHDAGLIWRASTRPDGPWSRLVIEKPFGHDLQSALELDRSLQQLVDESQIFRIDHYLGKETVQNVMAFRFANGLFEPVWNNKYIHSVQMTVAETLGVEQRGGYYEKSGALRDMVQNHMLQLLAVTAMEPPISLEANAIRDEKVKVLRAIRLPKSAAEVDKCSVRGQYGSNIVSGKQLNGYRDEEGVDPHSITPTYVAVRMYLDNWRWGNVPFFLRHGKRLPKRGTEIAIKFRTPPLALFRGTDICGQTNNQLVLRVQPDEGISLSFGAKEPGAGMKISNVEMNFTYEKSFNRKSPDAYERLLLDSLHGDPTLFTRSDEVQAMWRFADTLLKGWDQLPRPAFPNYPAGSWGPAEAEALFPTEGETPQGECPVAWRRW